MTANTHEAHRTGHNFATHQSISFHLLTLSGPFLLVDIDEYIVLASDVVSELTVHDVDQGSRGRKGDEGVHESPRA